MKLQNDNISYIIVKELIGVFQLFDAASNFYTIANFKLLIHIFIIVVESII